MASLNERLARLEHRAKPPRQPTEEEQALMSLLCKELRVQQAISEDAQPDSEVLKLTPAEERAELDAAEGYLEYLADQRALDPRPEKQAVFDGQEAETRQEIPRLKAKLERGARHDEG